MSVMTTDVSFLPPRILIVSRRSIRKNKFVDFVGEYHLDLIVRYGAVPVIVPRVSGVHMLLESFGPIHGVLLCEGEDINPTFYEEPDSSDLSVEELESIKRSHASEIAFDNEKDLIELRLAKLCIERNIPYLGICRGSQLLNVACGGTLYQDIEMELTKKCPEEKRVGHMNYDNYDGHRHIIRVVEETPLQQWFKDESGDNMEIMVNSYHHQGVKKLAQRFVPMAFAPDGLIEGFYDPDAYNPEEGKFIMGLQFHPERMRKSDSKEFDYPGCPVVYQEFVKATVAYQKRLMKNNNYLTDEKSAPLKLNNQETEMYTTKVIFKSFSLAKNIQSLHSNLKDSELIISPRDAEFLESKTTLSQQQEINRLKLLHEEREQMARSVIGKMSVLQLSHLLSFYGMMGRICSEVVERKLQVSNCM